MRTFKESVKDDLLNEGRRYYGDTGDGTNLRVLTRRKIMFIINFFSQIKDFEGLAPSDEIILTKVEDLKKKLDSKSVFWSDYWGLIGKTFGEKLTHFPNAEFAQNLFAGWNGVAELITLEEEDDRVCKELEKVVKRIEAGDDWTEIKKNYSLENYVISKDEVKSIIVELAGGNARPNDEIAESWTEFNKTGSEFLSSVEIKEWIGRYITGKKTEFVSHLNAKSKSDADKPVGNNEDEKVANFLKTKKAEEVIKAVISHQIENEDEKKDIVKKMKSEDICGQPLNINEYGAEPGTIEEPSDEAIIQFRYEEITAQDHKFVKKNEEKESEALVEKSWWKRYNYASIWGTVLVVTIVLVVVFWSSIVNWWNGPTEEDADDKEGK